MSERYVLDGHEPIPEPDLMKWAKWFEKTDRRVASTKIADDVTVSTVFLWLNHNFGRGAPLLFETMIFGGPHADYQERYTTWDEAEAGHAKAVEAAQGARKAS